MYRILGMTAGLMGAVLSCAAGPQPGRASDRSDPSGPLLTVQRRIEAFNRHDLEAYLATHHPEVDIIRYPDTLLGRGRAHLRRIFGPNLEAGEGTIETVDQTVIGSTVISEERLRLGGRTEHLVVLYSVAADQIRTMRLVEEGPSRPSSVVEFEAKAFLAEYFETLRKGDEDAIRALYVKDGRFRWDTDGDTSYRSGDDVLASLRGSQGLEFDTQCGSMEVVVASPSHAHVRCDFSTRALRSDGAPVFSFGGVMTFFIERQIDGPWAVVRGHTSSLRAPQARPHLPK
ncbi:MAG: nuclear transport factor 2 family protein [Myxococcota bacterium]